MSQKYNKNLNSHLQMNKTLGQKTQMYRSGQKQALPHQYMMYTSLGVTPKDMNLNQRMQLGGIGDYLVQNNAKVTPGNVKRHIEFDLLKDLDLDQQDINDIKFYKKKLVIDEFFKREKNLEKRKETF